MARYSTAQAAALLKISKSTLLRWERESKLPAPHRLKRNNQRIYTDEWLRKAREFADELIEPPKSRRRESRL